MRLQVSHDSINQDSSSSRPVEKIHKHAKPRIWESFSLASFGFILTTLSSIADSSEPQTQVVETPFNCTPLRCGSITFSFPFSSYDTFDSGDFACGLPRFQILCDHSTSIPSLLFSGRPYRVIDVFPSNEDRLITVFDNQLIEDLRSNSCRSLDSLRNFADTTNSVGGGTSLQLPPSPWNTSFSFFKCSIGIVMPLQVVVNLSCKENYDLYVWDDDAWTATNRFRPPNPGNFVNTPNGCELFRVPVFSQSLSNYGFLNGSAQGRLDSVLKVLADGFSFTWPPLDDCTTCQRQGRLCGYDRISKKTVCFCLDGCDTNLSNKFKIWWIISGVAGGSTFMIAVLLLLVFKYKKRDQSIFKVLYFWKNSTTVEVRNAELFIKDYKSMLLNKYSYHEIKKMTKGFKEKLGRGGHGNVYRGKLPDGRLIAVKMLNSLNDSSSSNFINEVATVGRIHHVNIISLLGYCLDNTERALIYEFMPNGSLGDLLVSKEAATPIGLARLLEIVLGIANGLNYLHTGCESRILHLDIKPHNILLDQNFDPKISDFGLAKMYSRDRSAVTMTGARGTIGYIAPEIFLRNIGNPSHKSDVYSFGMLLLEMVGGKSHFKPEEASSSSGSVYFPEWLYDKLQDLKSMDSVVEEEAQLARIMVMVGLWCIQMNPKDRPTMANVIEMLSEQGDIEMPPKPLVFSSSRRQSPQQEMESTESFTSDDLPLTMSENHVTSY